MPKRRQNGCGRNQAFIKQFTSQRRGAKRRPGNDPEKQGRQQAAGHAGSGWN